MTMKAKEWLEIIKQAKDYNEEMTPLIELYGKLLVDESKPDIKNILESQATPIKDEEEVCVMCDRETPYLRTTPIDLREFYVDGAGQLCKQCFNRTFEIKELEDDRPF